MQCQSPEISLFTNVKVLEIWLLFDLKHNWSSNLLMWLEETNSLNIELAFPSWLSWKFLRPHFLKQDKLKWVKQPIWCVYDLYLICHDGLPIASESAASSTVCHEKLCKNMQQKYYKLCKNMQKYASILQSMQNYWKAYKVCKSMEIKRYTHFFLF